MAFSENRYILIDQNAYINFVDNGQNVVPQLNVGVFSIDLVVEAEMSEY